MIPARDLQIYECVLSPRETAISGLGEANAASRAIRCPCLFPAHEEPILFVDDDVGFHLVRKLTSSVGDPDVGGEVSGAF